MHLNIIAMYKSTIFGEVDKNIVFKMRQTFHAAYDNFKRAREKPMKVDSVVWMI